VNVAWQGFILNKGIAVKFESEILALASGVVVPALVHEVGLKSVKPRVAVFAGGGLEYNGGGHINLMGRQSGDRHR
jgi:hypothetical protein